ncbi:hypothetical protein J6590_053156 [Homalodisca vitripennis]|nr:hypothetical protein J6590_053156 [Homalodisca vitripennis]
MNNQVSNLKRACSHESEDEGDYSVQVSAYKLPDSSGDCEVRRADELDTGTRSTNRKDRQFTVIGVTGVHKNLCCQM